VSAIIGHHPHCFQGYEIYNNTPIFYSLGNFFFPLNKKNELTNFGFVVILNLKNQKKLIDFEIIPYKQCNSNYKVNKLEGEELVRFNDELQSISRTIKDENRLFEKWNAFINRKSEFYLRSISPYNKYIFAILKRFKLHNFILHEKYLLKLLNLIRCESHRENLSYILKEYIYNR